MFSATKYGIYKAKVFIRKSLNGMFQNVVISAENGVFIFYHFAFSLTFLFSSLIA